MMFSEVPFNERIGAAKKAGFDAVEFWNWANKYIPALAKDGKDAGGMFVGCIIGTDTPSRIEQYANGAMLTMDNVELYAQMVEESILAVEPLGIKTFIATVGQELPDVPREAQQAAIIACLKAAVPILEKHGATIVLEPLNILVNHIGYYLATSKQGFEIIEAVNSPRVKLLYDIYHQQITEGNLIQNISKNVDLIGHFHLADNPGRNQPGTGEINYKNVMATISETDYDMWVGCEYRPTEGVSTVDSAQEILGIVEDLK